MHKLILPATMGVVALVVTTSAQQGNPIEAAAAALGAANVKSAQFTGSGSNFTFGQAYSAGGPWPRFNVKSYTATVDYDTGSMRLELVRTVPDPVPPGVSAFQGEQRQVQVLSGNYAWNVAQPPAGAPAPNPAPASEAVVAERKLLLWSTPHGFVKAAMANKATTRRAGGGSEVSFIVDGKHRFVGRLNAQNQV
jgi:hypothetical protein